MNGSQRSGSFKNYFTNIFDAVFDSPKYLRAYPKVTSRITDTLFLAGAVHKLDLLAVVCPHSSKLKTLFYFEKRSFFLAKFKDKNKYLALGYCS